MLRTLGYGSAPKILSSPLPLGGNYGVEMAISYEFLNISALSKLGNRQGSGEELSFPIVTFGKGLYYDVDFFLQFSPLPESFQMSYYSALVRWSFAELEHAPVRFSLMFSSGISTFLDVTSIRTTGIDIVLSYFLDDLSLYFGGGYIKTVGIFYSGPQGLASDLQTHIHEEAEFRNVVGLDYDFKTYFLSFEVNRVVDTALAFKMGLRL